MEGELRAADDVVESSDAVVTQGRHPRRTERGAVEMRNPYQVDRYASQGGTAPRGVRGAVSRAAGMLGCLIAMGVLFLGMIYVLWRAGGN